MFNFSDFKLWLDRNDYINKNFRLMEEVVTEYLNRALNFYDDDCPEYPAIICRQIPTVLSRCDEITYNEAGVPEAYIMLHFLDRYHRFQLIFLDMLQNGTFPIRDTINVMDVGTGPAPSLFALSDMVLLINQYMAETTGSQETIRINLDYVERSEGFRQFIHHAAEMILQKDHETFVPFHHGTYYDATKFQSGEKKLIYVDQWKTRACLDEDDYYLPVPQYVPYKRSFDMVIYSNFLTSVETVNKFQEQLKKTMFYLRNRGVMVIVGGHPDDKKYSAAYEQINQIFDSQKYTNKKFKGWYKQISRAKMMSYSADSEYNKIILCFLNQMFSKIPTDEWNRLDNKTKSLLNKFLLGTVDTKWYVSIYKRFSFLRCFDKKENNQPYRKG